MNIIPVEPWKAKLLNALDGQEKWLLDKMATAIARHNRGVLEVASKALLAAFAIRDRAATATNDTKIKAVCTQHQNWQAQTKRDYERGEYTCPELPPETDLEGR